MKLIAGRRETIQKKVLPYGTGAPLSTKDWALEAIKPIMLASEYTSAGSYYENYAF